MEGGDDASLGVSTLAQLHTEELLSGVPVNGLREEGG